MAVADLDLERLRRAGAAGTAHPALLPLEIPEGVATFATLDDMLQGAELDVADVCLPTFLHAASTVRAAEAGKHVLCEKPMAIVEVPALVDAGGVTPLCMGALPKGALGLTQALVVWEELTVDAALSGDRDLVLQAFLAHPWVPSAAQAETVCDEMFAAHAAHLPQFFGQ